MTDVYARISQRQFMMKNTPMKWTFSAGTGKLDGHETTRENSFCAQQKEHAHPRARCTQLEWHIPGQ